MCIPKVTKSTKKAIDKNKPWFVYLLQCRNDRLYTGITNDLAARFKKHCAGRGAMFTKLNAPSHIIAAKLCANRSTASILEYQIKQLTPSLKRALVKQWPIIKNLPTRDL